MPKKYAIKVRPIVHPIGPSIAYVALTRGAFALVDAQDASLLAGNNWIAAKDRKTGQLYAARMYRPGEASLMHRLILQPGSEQLADHINGNTLDNRRCNLRVVDHSQNACNRRAFGHSNTGFKGVHWCKTFKKYVVYVFVHGKKHSGGHHEDLASAIAARVELAKRVHGEYACYER